MKYKLLFSFIPILALSACTAVADIEPPMTKQADPPPTIDVGLVAPDLPTQESQKESTPMTQPIQLPSTSGLESLIEKAKEDLAHRLGVSVESITVTAVIGQEFSSDAFYCRVTKERIAREEAPQVISGHSILLSASGRRYEYHASGQTVIFCRPLR